MIDIFSLDLRTDGSYQFEAASLARLKRELADSTRVSAPRFRLIKVLTSSATTARIQQEALEEMQCEMGKLFAQVTDLKQRLRNLTSERRFVQVYGGGKLRDLSDEWLTLREQDEAPMEMMVLELEMPRETREPTFNVEQVLAQWREQCVAAARPGRRVERAPPQPPAAAKAASTTLNSLLADNQRFIDSSSVGRMLTSNPTHANPKMTTTRARRAGEIFGVWDGNAYRYPRFQFSSANRPRDGLNELIAVLPDDHDGSGRDAALWLFAPDAALDGRTPAEVFVDEPARVIALARTRRDGADDMD